MALNNGTWDRGSSELSLDQVLYRLILKNPSWLADDLAAAASVSAAEVETTLDELERAGLLAPSTATPGGYIAIDPDAALARLFAAEERQVRLHQEQLTSTRDSIRAIMNDFIKLRADERGVIEIESLRTAEQVNAFLDDVANMVNHRESSMHPGGIPSADLTEEILLRDAEMISRNIKIRSLYAQHVAEVPHMMEYLVSAAKLGMEVRLAPYLPLRMLIFDESLALLPIDPQDSSQGAFVIRGTELVRSLQAFFDFCWQNAVPLQSHTAAGRPNIDLTAQEELIIRMLASGMKDESIARQLGVSTRTLSRIISVFLERLEVSTRFQAGQKISDMGLLSFGSASEITPS